MKLITHFWMRDGTISKYFPGMAEGSRANFFQNYLLTKEGSEFDKRISEIEIYPSPLSGWDRDD